MKVARHRPPKRPLRIRIEAFTMTPQQRWEDSRLRHRRWAPCHRGRLRTVISTNTKSLVLLEMREDLIRKENHENRRSHLLYRSAETLFVLFIAFAPFVILQSSRTLAHNPPAVETLSDHPISPNIDTARAPL